METDEPRRVPTFFWAMCTGVFMIGMALRIVVDAATGPDADTEHVGHASAALALLTAAEPAPRSVSSYGGLGAWIDAFDFSPSYGGAEPPLTPAVVDDLAAVGVRTIYLQAARPDERSPGLLLEPDLLAEFLLRAHASGLHVVGWYLPTFEDVDRDLAHLLAVAEFDALGHTFDGVAVDIEYIEGVPDADDRSARLVDLSSRLRDARPGEALGAIVPPPVQLEVVNPAYWPQFPWRALDTSYDVWLPMAYWTTRTVESGYRDAYAYTEESTRRLRLNLGRPDAVVHPIGGIGTDTVLEDLARFRAALDDVDAIGGSLYDWNSLGEPLREAQADLLPE